MYRLFICFIALSQLINIAEAGVCTGVFPNGLQNNHLDGTISFGFNGQLTNGSSTELDSASAIIFASGSQPTCVFTNCTNSGSIAESIIVDDFGTGADGPVSLVNSEARTISPGNYTTLDLDWAAVLTLESGDYYFNGSFTNNLSQQNIILAGDGDGVVRIFVQGNVTFGQSTGINEGGSPDKLFLFSNGNITVGNAADISGFIYSKETVTLDYNSYVDGAINAKFITPVSTQQTVNFSALTPDFCDGSTLTGTLNVDNTFQAYISTDDSVQGTLLTSGSDWRTPETLSTTLIPGQDYYLHIYALDAATSATDVAGFLGDFEISGTEHTFENGLNTLMTNTTEWSVSTTGWNNYSPATSYGVYGVAPWYNNAGVRSSAEWIWSSDNAADNVNYFSAKIVASVDTEAPIFDYRFDECEYNGTTGEVVDQSGNYPATTVDVPALTDDSIINNSLDLTATGATDWVDIPQVAFGVVDDFSLSFWMRLDGNADKDRTIFHAYGGTEDELWLAFHNKNTLNLKVGNDDTTLNAGTNLDVDVWYHIVITRAGDDACLYIDGDASASNACTDNDLSSDSVDINDANDKAIIGQRQFSNGSAFDDFDASDSFIGKIDEFKYYSRELSASEVSTIQLNEADSNNYDGSTREDIECEAECEAYGLLSSVGIRINNSGSNTQVNSTTEAEYIYNAWVAAGEPATGLIDGGTYNIAASGSSSNDRIDFGGDEQSFTGTLPYPGFGSVGNESLSHFLVRSSGTISLSAGEYTIYVESDDGFSFVMETLSGSLVSFDKTGNSTAGADNELRFEGPTGNARTRGSFTLAENSVFDTTAIFFEQGGGDFFEISIGNGTLNNVPPSSYEILAHGALGGKVTFGDCVIPSSVDHYQIIHDGNALTCEPEAITIKACTNSYDGTCTESTEEVTLDVKADGSDSVEDSITFTGTGTASIAYTIVEPVVLSIDNETITATNPVVCFNGSTTSCELVFADTGFRFFSNSEGTVIPEQLSGKPSNEGFNISTLNIQAIEKNPDSGACQAAFIDANTIEMAATCVNPEECAGSNQVTINNLTNDILISTLDNSASTTYSSVDLDFSGNTTNTAEFIFTYPDAGQMQLHARYNLRDQEGNLTGNYMLGSSNAFVVRPFGFFIDVSGNPRAETHLDDKFKKAGEDFETTITAVQWQSVDDTNNDGVPDIIADLSNNSVTINFGNEISPETAVITEGLYLPDPTAGGVEGLLTNGSFNDFSAGIATNGVANGKSMTYSEVGIVSFTANLTGGSYLGASDIVGAELYVGRFTPAFFTQTVEYEGSLRANHDTDSSDGIDCTVEDWAYAGQTLENGASTEGAISYDTGASPVINIHAYNVAGAITQNYTDDDFVKLTSNNIIIPAPTHDDSALRQGESVGGDTIEIITADMTIGDALTVASPGVLRYTFNDADNFVYEHTEESKVNKFTAQIPFVVTEVQDSDSIALYNSAVDPAITPEPVPTVKVVPTGVEIRFGRWLLDNSYGPETSRLPIDMTTEYFDGVSFVTNTNEICLIPSVGSEVATGTIGDAGMDLWDYRLADDDLSPSQTTPSLDASNPMFTLGVYQSLFFSAPGDGYQGEAEFEYQVPPWLQYDWNDDGDYNNNPTATLNFGVYRGNDRIIYQREIEIVN